MVKRSARSTRGNGCRSGADRRSGACGNGRAVCPGAARVEPGTSYAQYAPFVYDGVMYFTRQAVTAMEHQPPGSAGMEAIYGIRPIPDDDGVYPYVYNMAAVAGMRVRENGETYVCTRDIDPLLYPPSQVAAHFTKE